ncbi:hypothetical protein P6U16_21450 (plasmid) [Rhizobium sp. 32-5/1]|uniref:DUF6894 family protein n=1 Tax=Rhizobium sp. 32-5/1 TaxID=3019602 RepID=UPI00240E1100|nr:hypothetical protein [Rhizobium sp. 32-5/1]WEZ85655.1 hypothetical protein P6U16_21450 [Rhizobium sp. 32-5/1]
MLVHFTFNDGNGVQQDGTQSFEDVTAAKREALSALAQSLQEDLRSSGEILGSVAGLDESGQPLFSVTMRVMIDDVSPEKVGQSSP